MERVKTGITGLDDILYGGLMKGSLTLVTGTTGTGKTIIGSQFLYSGGLKKEPGVYVSFEEPPENIKENMKVLGMDFSKMEKDNLIHFVKYDPYHIEDIYDLIESAVRKLKARRVVVDSISAFGLYVRDPSELRRMIFNLSVLLRKLNCTSILISEILPQQKSLSRFGVEEFISDAVIVLYYLRTNSSYARAVTVWKIRGSDHSYKLHPYSITNKGVIIYPKEEAFVKF